MTALMDAVLLQVILNHNAVQMVYTMIILEECVIKTLIQSIQSAKKMHVNPITMLIKHQK